MTSCRLRVVRRGLNARKRKTSAAGDKDKVNYSAEILDIQKNIASVSTDMNLTLKTQPKQ